MRVKDRFTLMPLMRSMDILDEARPDKLAYTDDLRRVDGERRFRRQYRSLSRCSGP